LINTGVLKATRLLLCRGFCCLIWGATWTPRGYWGNSIWHLDTKMSILKCPFMCFGDSTLAALAQLSAEGSACGRECPYTDMCSVLILRSSRDFTTWYLQSCRRPAQFSKERYTERCRLQLLRAIVLAPLYIIEHYIVMRTYIHTIQK